MQFRIELVWKDDNNAEAPSIFLVPEGRVILQGAAVSAQERAKLSLPAAAALISVDRNLIRAIKDML